MERDGAYVHATSTAVFIGDLIDRGTQQLETLQIVRAMDDAGSALVVLGNHEFNAVAWATRNEMGEWCRPHTPKNFRQHCDFLAEVVDGSATHQYWVSWFRTIPMWLDLGGLRVVHACWHEASMATLAPHLSPTRSLTDAVVCARDGALFDAVEILLKGPEIPLGEGRSYVDKDGNERHEARYRWWDPAATTLRAAAEIPSDAQTLDLPDDALDTGALARYSGDIPVIHGHYWRTGEPKVTSPKIACVDYSAGKGGDLVAYRWSGEATTDRRALRVVSGNCHEDDHHLSGGRDVAPRRRVASSRRAHVVARHTERLQYVTCHVEAANARRPSSQDRRTGSIRFDTVSLVHEEQWRDGELSVGRRDTHPKRPAFDQGGRGAMVTGHDHPPLTSLDDDGKGVELEPLVG